MTKDSTDQKKGFSFAELINQGKLAWNLFRDPNVSPWIRFGIPIIGLIYLISPVDIIPDVFLGVGQLDDIAVILLLAKLLISLAPDNVVQMYQQASQAAAGFNYQASQAAPADSTASKPAANADDDVIDTDYRVVS